MKIGQYCQRQRCRHVELEQFWQAFASRGFVSDSWAFLFYKWGSIYGSGYEKIWQEDHTRAEWVSFQTFSRSLFKHFYSALKSTCQWRYSFKISIVKQKLFNAQQICSTRY